MYAPRRLVDDLPLLAVVADLGKILVSTSSSEVEKRVENVFHKQYRGRHSTNPIRRINVIRYDDDAMLKVL